VPWCRTGVVAFGVCCAGSGAGAAGWPAAGQQGCAGTGATGWGGGSVASPVWHRLWGGLTGVGNAGSRSPEWCRNCSSAGSNGLEAGRRFCRSAPRPGLLAGGAWLALGGCFFARVCWLESAREHGAWAGTAYADPSRSRACTGPAARSTAVASWRKRLLSQPSQMPCELGIAPMNQTVTGAPRALASLPATAADRTPLHRATSHHPLQHPDHRVRRCRLRPPARPRSTAGALLQSRFASGPADLLDGCGGTNTPRFESLRHRRRHVKPVCS